MANNFLKRLGTSLLSFKIYVPLFPKMVKNPSYQFHVGLISTEPPIYIRKHLTFLFLRRGISIISNLPSKTRTARNIQNEEKRIHFEVNINRTVLH